MTGASILREEWSEHISVLKSEGKLIGDYVKLEIVGMIGSIDNDLVGFTHTIGSDSALHRVIYSIDCINSTAESHSRNFVVEVMGRDCGYLALAASVICGADWVFIPEAPPNAKSWKDELKADISSKRTKQGRVVIILAEGAIDSEGNKISAEDVKSVIEKDLQMETRITYLGHVQRGGAPSAFDRYQSTMLGVAAVDALANQSDTCSIVGLNGYCVEEKPLQQCIANTRAVGAYLKNKEFHQAFKSRGSAFRDFWDIQLRTSGLEQHPRGKEKEYHVAICTVGAPAPGMNHAVRVLTKLLLEKGHTTYLVKGGYDGLRSGDISEANWMSCSQWAGSGGAFLGTGRSVPDSTSIPGMIESLKRYDISSLIVVGGFEAYVGATTLMHACPELNMVMIPATISNNLPGTHVSIGMDKASNNLLQATDNIKQSCIGYQKRVFVVESIGRHCGFQTLFGGVISGAEQCYLPERNPTLDDMEALMEVMRDRFSHKNAQVALFLFFFLPLKLFSSDGTHHQFGKSISTLQQQFHKRFAQRFVEGSQRYRQNF